MLIGKITYILKDYRRVLSVAKKPTVDELRSTIRVCGIGIAIIGVLGFMFFMLFSLAGGA